MTVCAILMCGGRQARMGDHQGAKQLVPVCGEPVAARTVRMLRERCSNVLFTVVAPQAQEWIKFCVDHGANRADTPDKLFLAALVKLLTRPLPVATKFLVLCGDVVWSPEMMDAFLDMRAEVQFAARFVPNIHTGRDGGELYGVAVENFARTDLVRATDKILVEARATGHIMRQHAKNPEHVEEVIEKNGRLWQLLHTLEDGPCGSYVVECGWADYIDDIDGPDDLARLPKIEAVIKAREALQ